MSTFTGKDYTEIPKKYLDPSLPKEKDEGSRVNGKDWKIHKDAFRMKALGVNKGTSFAKRNAKRLEEEQYKARINELKNEKEEARQSRINDLKRRREIKAEKERYEKLATKFHQKKVDRLRKKEKRNKLLKER